VIVKPDNSLPSKPKATEGTPLQPSTPVGYPDAVLPSIEKNIFLCEFEKGKIFVDENDLADQFQNIHLNSTEEESGFDEAAEETEFNCDISPEEQFRLVCLNRVSEEDDLHEDDDSIIMPWSFEDFDVIERLGKGASGVVYEAKEVLSGYSVALKVQEATEEARCEMDIHADLDHPGIIKMIDYFYADEPIEDLDNNSTRASEKEDKPTVYLILILELCKEALFDTIRDNPNRNIDEDKAASMFYQAFHALDYFHNQGMIHCDIKSLNFLTTHDGTQLKLADFGMAVREDEKEVVGGSPVYMSPEHLMAWRNFDACFDHRSDVYSLGVVLFETLTGYLPYQVIQDDEDYYDVLEDRLAEDPILDLRNLDNCTTDDPVYVPPPILPDFLSPDACDLIERLMAANPDDRISLEEAMQHRWFQMHGLGLSSR
jgi:serine/threonine protein kinase